MFMLSETLYQVHLEGDMMNASKFTGWHIINQTLELKVPAEMHQIPSLFPAVVMFIE